jgi:hypothetical protein
MVIPIPHARGASRKALLSPVIVHVDGRCQRDRLPVEDVARPVRLPVGAGFGRRTPPHPKTPSHPQDGPAVLGIEGVPSSKPPGKHGVSEGFRAAGVAETRSRRGFLAAALLNRTQEVAGSSPASSMKPPRSGGFSSGRAFDVHPGARWSEAYPGTADVDQAARRQSRIASSSTQASRTASSP